MDEHSAEPPWLQELLSEVQTELDRRHENHGDRRPALAKELDNLERDINGFTRSFADPILDPAVRKMISDQLTATIEKRSDIENELRTLDAAAAQVRQLVDKKAILDRLDRLPEILASGNVTEGNAELSRHIDKIICHPDGSVVVRTCKLGALAGVLDLFAKDPAPADNPAVISTGEAIPRRRSPLRMDDRETADFAVDVERFADLDDRWFREDVFHIPPPAPCWAEVNAEAVAAKRSGGLTHEKLAKLFGVTTPTIRKALKFAQAKNPELPELPRKMPRVRWEEQNFEAVAVAKREHPDWKMKDYVQHFGKCETMISRAMKIANATPKIADSGEAAAGADDPLDRQAS